MACSPASRPCSSGATKVGVALSSPALLRLAVWTPYCAADAESVTLRMKLSPLSWGPLATQASGGGLATSRVVLPPSFESAVAWAAACMVSAYGDQSWTQIGRAGAGALPFGSTV